MTVKLKRLGHAQIISCAAAHQRYRRPSTRYAPRRISCWSPAKTVGRIQENMMWVSVTPGAQGPTAAFGCGSPRLWGSAPSASGIEVREPARHRRRSRRCSASARAGGAGDVRRRWCVSDERRVDAGADPLQRSLEILAGLQADASTSLGSGGAPGALRDGCPIHLGTCAIAARRRRRRGSASTWIWCRPKSYPVLPGMESLR